MGRPLRHVGESRVNMSNNGIMIAIDAAGGEHAPREIVNGAIKAAQEPVSNRIVFGAPFMRKKTTSRTIGVPGKAI